MLHEPAIDRPVAQLVGGVGLVQMPVVPKLMSPIAAAQADVEVAELLGHAQFAVKILARACAEVANQRRTVGIGHGRLAAIRSEEHTSELQSLMRISYAVFCLKKQRTTHKTNSR